jgi:hypothetical protein
VWGVGLHPSIVSASLRAVVNAVNRAEAQRPAATGSPSGAAISAAARPRRARTSASRG